MDIFDQIEQPSGRRPNPYTVNDMGEVVEEPATMTKRAAPAPKGDIFDQVAPRGLSKYNDLLGGENAQIKSAPGFLTNLSQAFTAPFHQEREPIAADQPRPGMVGRALESAGAVGKGILGLLNSPFETIAPTVTKYAGENLPIEPRTAEAIGNAAGVVAQGSILPWRSRAPLAPARNIEDLITAPRPGLPAPPERLALPPAAQPRLNPPEMVTQVTPEGVASQAPKRTIIDLVDEVKRDVKQQVVDEIFQELKSGRPQAAAGAPKQAAPLSIEDLRGQLAPEARATAAPAAPPAAQPAMVTHVNSEGVATQAPIDEILQKLKTSPATPMFEQTEAGKQAVIPGAEARTIPQGGLRPKRAQTEAPLDLEQPALRAQEPELALTKEAAPTAAPRRPVQRLEDSEVAMSTFIQRQGGMNIPKNLKEEFGGWNRLHNPKGLGVDVMADEAFNAGLLPEPTTSALLDSLKSGRKSARMAGEAGQAKQMVNAELDRHIKGLQEEPAGVEYKGHDYEAVIPENGGVRLKDNPDKVLKKADDIFKVEGKVPFDVPGEAPKQTTIQDRIAQLEAENAVMRNRQQKGRSPDVLTPRDVKPPLPGEAPTPAEIALDKANQRYAEKTRRGAERIIAKQNAGVTPPTPETPPLPGERTAGDIIGGEKGAAKEPWQLTREEWNDVYRARDSYKGNKPGADSIDALDADIKATGLPPGKRSLIDVQAWAEKSGKPRTAGDILKGESGALKFGRDKPPETFGPPIEPPEVRGGIQSPKFDFSKWNDKAALSLSRETLERNIDAVAPAADAAKVQKFITQPVRQNETNRINYNNALRTETRGAVVEKLGIKAGSKEDALTQAYGEGRLPLAELKTLTPNWQKVVSASDYFRAKYDTLLDTVNAARAKFGYEPIPKRKDYFRHFQDIDNIIKNFGVILRTEDLPTEISGLTEGFKPGKPFSTAELQRKGGSYTMSAVRGFDNYIDSISKQIFHIDSVQRARGLENYIRQAAGAENAKLPNLVANLHEYGNLLAGKKSTFDRAFESLFGRKFYAAVNVLRGRTSANMVGGNVSSALTNFIPFTQAAATTEKGSLAKGMLQATIAPFEKDPAAIDGIASSFLTRRYPEGAISPTIGDKLKTGANFLFDAVDKFTARSVVGGKYYEGINNGLSPKAAMQAADTYAGKVLTDRSLGQLPNLFNIKTLGPVTQFQTEINNMYSFMTKDIPALSGSKAKTVKALSEFVLYSYLFNSGFEKVTGRRPTIDPLHFLITLAGDGDIKQKLSAFNEDILSNLPLIGGISGGRLPISAGLPDVAGMIKGEKGIGSELSKPAFFLAPPFGGLQAKKTIEGVGAFDAGQVRSASGDKKLFDIEQSPQNLVRSALFGKYSTPEAREYFDSGQLTPRQKMLKQLGLKDMGKDRNEKRKEMLKKLGLDR